MGTRIQSHQLKSGLVVSGRLGQQQKEKQPTMASRAVPYTGGDIKKSGELGKMFDIPAAADPPKQPPSRASTSSSGSMRNSSSGPMRNSSGPLNVVLPTGLFTSGSLGSGPLGSGPLGSGSQKRSGQLDNSAVGSGTGSGSSKALYGSAVTSLADDVKVGLRVSRPVVWVVMVVVLMGLLVGAFLMVAVKKAVILVAVGAVLVPLFVGLIWNCAWGRRGLLGFVRRYPDTALRGAIDGQYVKVTGVVTCGSIPLESSYQRVSRCVYVSSELYEYRGLGGKSAHAKHCFFSWGLRHSEKFVADFYVSDFQSGLRALVKAGYGAKVAPFVKPATVVDVKKENKDMSPSFLRWLADRNLSSDDRIMRLKEGYGLRKVFSKLIP
uniref:Aspartic endopeptidase family protein n=1 Tax=Populus tomentosa TaxID=118781 RepID=A0A1X9IXU2_POPTO|nr:aspartic endopeptidase family protein [Populus tomentosa]